MEVYILDSLNRRSAVIDRFNSLIWTERMSAIGDFELLVNATNQNRNQFIPGTRLAMNESYRVMTIKTVEDTTDAEGLQLLKLTGPSLEKILDQRIAMAALTDLTTDPKWILTGLPMALARQIYHDICATGILNTGDIIAGVTEASIFPVDTIAEPSDTIVYEMDPQTVYSAIKQLADAYGFGFRMVREPVSSGLYWDVYAGSDRTTQQHTLPAVVFSPTLDNLYNTKSLTTIEPYKNVAYVVSPVGHEIVYPLDVDPSVAGFERNVLLVKADDITDVDAPTASARMIQRGKEALAQNRQFAAFDGEIGQYSNYRPNVDYYLGDLVELRSTTGATNQMQVSELIYVSDKEGEKRYPTLAINKFITPGSWSSWDFNQVWEDLDPDPQTWADQP